jgi:hypothetical protein
MQLLYRSGFILPYWRREGHMLTGDKPAIGIEGEIGSAPATEREQ